ncbi:hypothetical protein CORC01_12857 [Colletotrichum orchidophilum]|uniref:Uncharacterized protein n=1 Tax=Colletotrichum orchidophilum TaxID=1209926 RepID=A0A1G4ARR2_9PEZI|nr:uncharacterized protein CORC01_12857 [Colletotrichum orchidophilum]OHE91849.1 hypothetical protein CORC01_12857 [Colletotrichum orchidophilum]
MSGENTAAETRDGPANSNAPGPSTTTQIADTLIEAELQNTDDDGSLRGEVSVTVSFLLIL